MTASVGHDFAVAFPKGGPHLAAQVFFGKKAKASGSALMPDMLK
jgi:hypothetical protein